jgi:hypothetical protein
MSGSGVDVEIGDLDLDEHADVVVIPGDAYTADAFYGDGGGGFDPIQTYTFFGELGFPQSFRIGDVTNSASADDDNAAEIIYCIDSASTVGIYMGFTTEQSVQYGYGGENGCPDLEVLNMYTPSPLLEYVVLDGFGAAVSISLDFFVGPPVTSHEYIGAVADGARTLAVVEDASMYYVVTDAPSEGGLVWVYTYFPSEAGSSGETGFIPVDDQVKQVRAGSPNGASAVGQALAVSYDGLDEVDVWTFSGVEIGDFATEEPQEIAWGDFDGDGREDVLILHAGATNDVEVRLSLTADAWSDPQTLALPAAPIALGVGDVNEDGVDDIAVLVDDPDTQVLLYVSDP